MAETAVLLVDGNNLNLGPTQRLDFAALKAYLEGKFNLVSLQYFFALRPVMDEEAYERHQSFIAVLVRLGIKTRQKMMRKGFEGNWKGDCDIDIALAAADAFQVATWVILLTNDTDFLSVIDYGHRCSKKVAIVTANGQVALELKNEADLVIDLSEESEMFFSPTALEEIET